MANTIRIKRRPSSGSAGSPSAASLYNGELAFNENDNTLYYAYGSGVGGISTAVPAIAGSGAYSLRGGTNASGTWPISVNGNSASVTNGVYITGDQTVGGQKTFSASPVVSGNLAGQLVFKSANAVNGGNIIFDGVNLGSETSYIKSSTAGMDVTHGTKIQLNSALEVLASNTSSNSVGYFAVFDSNPASSLTTLKSVSRDQILDDIGAATSGLDITAGSGLVGGGTLSQNRRFDVGQGDGISVSDHAIAVDSTVVRTTGTQSIGGAKTFTQQSTFYSGVLVGGINRFSIGGGGAGFGFQIDRGDNVSDKLAFDVDTENFNDSGYTTTLKTYGPAQDIIVRLPDTSGTLALDKRDMIAGSGLVGGGTLAADRTFNIGQGDGITVSADSIAVNSTVVRTTGNQDIVGVKRFFESSNNNIIFSTSDDKIYVKAPNTSDQTYYFVGLDGGGSPPSSSSADRSLVSRSTSQVKTDLSLNNVENLALSGITFTAGSGLVGGGTLAANRTFDINTGDGIQIVSDAVAVDSTVVRTTGTQTIAGVKTLSNRPVLNSGLSVLMTSTASSGLFFPVLCLAQQSYEQNPPRTLDFGNSLSCPHCLHLTITLFRCPLAKS